MTIANELNAGTCGESSNPALRFKNYVHARLDNAGVPHDPYPEKTVATGCRIGNRLDWLFAHLPPLRKNNTESRPGSINEILAELRSVKDERKAIAERDSDLSKQETRLNGLLLAWHEREGLDKVTGAGLSITFKEQIRVSVDPQKWQTFYEWAVSSGNWHVLYKQISSSKVVELIGNGVAMPDGVTTSSYTDINWRRV